MCRKSFLICERDSKSAASACRQWSKSMLLCVMDLLSSPIKSLTKFSFNRLQELRQRPVDLATMKANLKGECNALHGEMFKRYADLNVMFKVHLSNDFLYTTSESNMADITWQWVFSIAASAGLSRSQEGAPLLRVDTGLLSGEAATFRGWRQHSTIADLKAFRARFLICFYKYHDLFSTIWISFPYRAHVTDLCKLL